MSISKYNIRNGFKIPGLQEELVHGSFRKHWKATTIAQQPKHHVNHQGKQQ